MPPEWHAWLHHIVADPPPPGGAKRAGVAEAAPAEPHRNRLAYRPPGHDYKGGQRARATGDYEPWTPS